MALTHLVHGKNLTNCQYGAGREAQLLAEELLEQRVRRPLLERRSAKVEQQLESLLGHTEARRLRLGQPLKVVWLFRAKDETVRWRIASQDLLKR